MRAKMSSLAASVAGLCVKVWSVIVGVFLFIPRFVHNLAVRPDDDNDHGGGHLLVWEFGQAYRHLPSLLRSLAFKTRNLDDQLRESMLKGNLRRSFTQFDLFMVGIGLVVGSGVFYKGGFVQATMTGSGVFLGYIMCFVPIFLTALIFAEFTVEYPVAGGAFTWTMSTLGEFPALMSLGFLTINYILTIAAVARVLANSIALLFNTSLSSFVIDIGGTELDFLSFGIILILTLVLCSGTRESGLMLAAANATSLIFILFVGIAGFVNAKPDKFVDDWLPNGSSGLFQSLPALLFAYIGFDAIAYSIEEAKDVRDAPPAYIWTCLTAAVLYVFMALSLSFMVTSDELSQCVNSMSAIQEVDCGSPGATKAYFMAFVFAFDLWGMGWMQYIFAIGSIICIMTTLLVALFVSARLIMVGAREWMVPPILASVSTRTKTPIVAQVLVGVISSILALFTGYNKLSDLASFAYLCTMILVCNAYLGRRYYPDVKLRYSQYGTVEATAARFMGIRSNASKESDSVRTISVTQKWSELSRGSLGAPGALTTNIPSGQPPSGLENASVPKGGANGISNGMMNGNIGVKHGTSDKHGRKPFTQETGAGTSDSDATKKDDKPLPGTWTVLNLSMSKRVHRSMVWIFLILINASSICVGVLYRVYPTSPTAFWPLIAWAVFTIAMWMVCPVEYEPKTWKIHRCLLPFVPSVAILGIVFTNCNLEVLDYIYSLVIAGAVALFYVFFSMPLSYIRNHSSASKGDGVRVIDLVYKHGNWISVDQMTTHVAFFDERCQSGSPGINSLPESIVERNRTISRTLSRMGTASHTNSLSSIGSMQQIPSGMSSGFSGLPQMPGRFSSEDGADTMASAGSCGSMDMHRNMTNRLQIPRPKLETITDTSLLTNASRSTLSPSSTMDKDVSESPKQRDQ